MKTSQKVGIIIGIILLIPLWVPLMLRIAGYYVNEPGWRIAEKAVAQNNVNLCSKIIIMPWSVFIPSTTEQRDLCIYEYASATHDARVCEALLPSEYGWSCLGTVEEKIFLGDPCYYSSVHDRTYCNVTYSEGELTIKHPQMNDCSKYERRDVREWCHYERSVRMTGVNECDQISHSLVKDNCFYGVAFKERNPLLCNAIDNMERRDFCAFRVQMTLKYR